MLNIKYKSTLFFLFFFIYFYGQEGFWNFPFNKFENSKKNYDLKYKKSEYLTKLNSIKYEDFIVKIADNCTGTIVSNQGEILTAKHCIVPFLNDIYDLKNNDDSDFTFNQKEIKIPNLYVKKIHNILDITDHLNNFIYEPELFNIEKEKILKKYSENGKYFVELKNYPDFKIYLYIYEVYNDLRTNLLDFDLTKKEEDYIFLKIYKDNIPLETTSYPKISKFEYNTKEDFVYSLGFPSESNRFISSFELKNNVIKKINYENDLISLLMKNINDNYYLQKGYDEKLNQLNFEFKNNQNTIHNINKYRIIQQKEKKEKEINIKKNTYLFYNQYKKKNEIYNKNINKLEFYKKIFLNSKLINIPYKLSEIINFYLIQDKNKSENLKKSIDSIINSEYKNYDINIENDFLCSFLKKYKDFNNQNINLECNELQNKTSNSIFYNKYKLNDFLKNPKLYNLSDDYLYKIMQKLNKEYDDLLKLEENQAVEKILLKNKFKLNYYPNNYYEADSTLRISFGKLKKITSNNNIHLFESSIDTIAGSSGSPVFNKDGTIIGIAIDGNDLYYTSKYFYEKNQQRTINIFTNYIYK